MKPLYTPVYNTPCPATAVMCQCTKQVLAQASPSTRMQEPIPRLYGRVPQHRLPCPPSSGSMPYLHCGCRALGCLLPGVARRALP